MFILGNQKNMATNLVKLQIESYTKLLSNKSQFNPYQAFMHREELREQCKNDAQATVYLEKFLKEVEISLNNILNFYPHN